MEGINATYIAAKKFSVEDNLTDLLTVGKNIKANCGADGFRYGSVSTVSYVTSASKTEVTFNGESDSLTSNLTTIWYEAAPHMEDGRPIVRSDTRPMNTQTYFSMAGDDQEIGDGKALRWDFSGSSKATRRPPRPRCPGPRREEARPSDPDRASARRPPGRRWSPRSTRRRSLPDPGGRSA